jgi:hypothetical protein
VLTGQRSATELQKVTLMSTAQSIGKCWGRGGGTALMICSDMDLPVGHKPVTDRRGYFDNDHNVDRVIASLCTPTPLSQLAEQTLGVH